MIKSFYLEVWVINLKSLYKYTGIEQFSKMDGEQWEQSLSIFKSEVIGKGGSIE